MKSFQKATSKNPSELLGLLPYLFHIASCQARQCHLPVDDVEDCAMEFVEKLFVERPTVLRTHQKQAGFDCWLQRCAHNHAQDYRRRLEVIHKRATRSCWQDKDTDQESPREQASSTPDAHARVTRCEVRQYILKAVDHLTPLSRELFLAHFLSDLSWTELALATGRTPDFLRVTVGRAAKQIRVTLTQQGITKLDAEEYLALMERA